MESAAFVVTFGPIVDQSEFAGIEGSCWELATLCYVTEPTRFRASSEEKWRKKRPLERRLGVRIGALRASLALTVYATFFVEIKRDSQTRLLWFDHRQVETRPSFTFFILHNDDLGTLLP